MGRQAGSLAGSDVFFVSSRRLLSELDLHCSSEHRNIGNSVETTLQPGECSQVVLSFQASLLAHLSFFAGRLVVTRRSYRPCFR